MRHRISLNRCCCPPVGPCPSCADFYNANPCNPTNVVIEYDGRCDALGNLIWVYSSLFGPRLYNFGESVILPYSLPGIKCVDDIPVYDVNVGGTWFGNGPCANNTGPPQNPWCDFETNLHIEQWDVIRDYFHPQTRSCDYQCQFHARVPRSQPTLTSPIIPVFEVVQPGCSPSRPDICVDCNGQQICVLYEYQEVYRILDTFVVWDLGAAAGANNYCIRYLTFCELEFREYINGTLWFNNFSKAVIEHMAGIPVCNCTPITSDRFRWFNLPFASTAGQPGQYVQPICSERDWKQYFQLIPEPIPELWPTDGTFAEFTAC